MIKIIVESGSNLTAELLKKYDISYLRTEVSYKDKIYPSSLEWEYFSPEDLINYMKEGNLPEISQPAVGKWVEEIKEILKEGKDIAYLATSSHLAGSVRAFNIAKKLIKTNQRLEVFEIAGAAGTIELIALKISKNLTEKTTFEDIQKQVDDFNSKVHFYGLPESLRQWAFSGRAQGKKDFSYPAGYPVVKGRPDGAIRPLGLYESQEEAFKAFEEDIKDIKASECVINYMYDTDLSKIKRMEEIMTNTLGCKILAETMHCPSCTCVGGVNSVDVAFV